MEEQSDDNRMPLASRYEVVRSYATACTLLSVFGKELERMDLDYDLGGEKTGFDLLVYMKEKEIFPTYINIHSDHPNSRKMVKYAEKNFPQSIISNVVK